MPMIPVRTGMAPKSAIAICSPRLFMSLLPVLSGANSFPQYLANIVT
jgi:hypothetical protein